MNLQLGERPLTLAELRAIAAGDVKLSLHPSAAAHVAASSAVVQRIASGDTAVYGVNTGIGKLASTRIPREQLAQLQRNIILSHAVGVGNFLDTAVVRLVLALKIASFSQGHSGVRPIIVEALLACYHRGLLPCIPAKGSVGASGDLAPLAHLATVLMGEGEATLDGRRMPAAEALAAAGIPSLELGPKEGVALINGTQVSTALALSFEKYCVTFAELVRARPPPAAESTWTS